MLLVTPALSPALAGLGLGTASYCHQYLGAFIFLNDIPHPVSGPLIQFFQNPSGVPSVSYWDPKSKFSWFISSCFFSISSFELLNFKFMVLLSHSIAWNNYDTFPPLLWVTFSHSLGSLSDFCLLRSFPKCIFFFCTIFAESLCHLFPSVPCLGSSG